MSAQRRRALLVATVMAVVAAVGGILAHREPVAARPLDLDRSIPERFGTWHTDPVAMPFVRAADRRGQATQLYDQVFERTYVDDQGRRVMLSIAYGADQSSDLQLHRPEVCYRAGGFEVDGVHAARLELGRVSLPVTRLVAEMPGRPEPVTYWMVVGGELARPAARSWSDRLFSMLKPRATDGLLVRVSSIDPQADDAYRLQTAFARDLLRSLPTPLRLRMIGRPAVPDAG